MYRWDAFVNVDKDDDDEADDDDDDDDDSVTDLVGVMLMMMMMMMTAWLTWSVWCWWWWWWWWWQRDWPGRCDIRRSVTDYSTSASGGHRWRHWRLMKPQCRHTSVMSWNVKLTVSKWHSVVTRLRCERRRALNSRPLSIIISDIGARYMTTKNRLLSASSFVKALEIRGKTKNRLLPASSFVKALEIRGKTKNRLVR